MRAHATGIERMFVYPDRKVKELRLPETSIGLRSQAEGNPPSTC